MRNRSLPREPHHLLRKSLAQKGENRDVRHRFYEQRCGLLKKRGGYPPCSFRSPWQNGIAERWVGSVRRDLLDHVIVLNERHLRRLLKDPTLPQGCRCSTIGPGGLNYRVRDGNGWCPSGMIAGKPLEKRP